MSTNHPAIWTKPTNGVDNYASDSSGDEGPQVRMRVGEMYQAQVPIWFDDSKSKPPYSKEGMLIWSPNNDLADEKLDAYCQIAKNKHSYNREQALGMLFWHKHDIKKSLNDMQNFTPMPDEWSMEDRVLFEQAYNFHGKNFRKIQQLIPDKEISQLVKHYYTWKKSRTKTSLMDKQANKPQQENDSDGSQPDEDQVDIEMEDEKRPAKKLHLANSDDIKHKLPKGIQLSVDDITILSEHEKGVAGYLDVLDESLSSIKRNVQTVKQETSALVSELSSIERPEDTKQELQEEWSEEDKLLAVEGVKMYGEDCEAIAEILASKPAEKIKEFFVAHRTQLNLDEILEERQKNEEQPDEKEDEITQTS